MSTCGRTANSPSNVYRQELFTKEAGHDQFNVYTSIINLEERPCNLLCGFTQELRVNLHTDMVAERKREDR